MRKFTEKTLVIASHNKGKIKEIGELLGSFNVEVIAGNSDLPEPVEDADSFLANAKIKSAFFSQAMGLPALSDDSGLCVPALDNAPGIYSARWAGESKDFNAAMLKIEKALKDKGLNPEGQSAFFVCALSLMWPDGFEVAFEGKVYGHLTFPPRGEKGFGYDPIFIPEGYNITFAEMEPMKKHQMSHRASAFKQLVDACFR